MVAGRITAWLAYAAVVAVGPLASPERTLAQAPAAAELSGVPAEPGPLEQQSKAIPPEDPIPRRVSHVMPVFPVESRARLGTFRATIALTIDESGKVAEARPIESPLQRTRESELTAFERSAIDAVRRWTYEPPARPPMTLVAVFGFSAGSDTQLVGYGPLTQRTSGFGPAQNPAWQSATSRTPPRKILDRKPRFPSGARLDKGGSAIVITEITIGIDGRVTDARVIQGSAPFDAPALEAVRGWEFTPALADGKPVPFTMRVTVAFSN